MCGTSAKSWATRVSIRSTASRALRKLASARSRCRIASFRSWLALPSAARALFRWVMAAAGACPTRIACQVLTAVPATRARATRPAVVRATRLRRADLRKPVPRRRRAASTGWSVRYRITSAAKSLAVSYRRLRSFSSAFITIQSSSPRTDRRARRGSACRLAETVVSVSPSVLSRVLGFGGSSSRMIRRISSKAACLSVSESNGVVPVSSS